MLTPSPDSIHVSILSQCVTIRHPTALSHLVITEAIEDAGFDIADTTGHDRGRLSDRVDSSSHSRSRKAEIHLEHCQVCQYELMSGVESIKVAGPSAPSGKFPPEVTTNKTGYLDDLPHSLTLSVGGMSCASCTSTVTQVLSQLPGVRDVSVSLLGNSATAILDKRDIVGDVLKSIKDIGYEAEVASIQPLNPGSMAFEMDGSLRVAFSVGGMTCAACSSTITRLLSEQEGVTGVTVNLIGNSASLVVKSKGLITEVQEVIECAGFDASVASVEPLQVIPNTTEVSQGQRTVALRIEGMFCE